MKLPRCWRCNKLIRKKIIGKNIAFRFINSYNYFISPELPNPICDKCMESFIQWFKDGLIEI